MAPPRNPNYERIPGDSHPYQHKACEGCGEVKLIRVDLRYCSKSCSARKQHADGRSRQVSGAEHYAWKGSDAGYQALHNRVTRARGNADHCEQRPEAGCRSVKYEWAHVHGTDPGDPANYRSLCKSCHQRYDKQVGPDHASARLTGAQAGAIRALYAAGGVSQQAIADLYGVHQGTVSRILLGKTYR
jgi:hypothetical protein